MEQEIKDIIAKNLPQHVGEVIRERLNKADEDAAQVDKLYKTLAQKEEALSDLSIENAKLVSMLDRQVDIEERERKVREREINFELEITKLKLDAAEKKTDMMSGIINTVFRSPVYRKHIDNMSLSSYDSMGRMNVTNAVPTNISESID